MSEPLTALVPQIRQCQVCARYLPHAPRPVLQVSSTARLCIAGQAPGARVHISGKPFTDPSGNRLRRWMGVDEETFYDNARIAIVPMGFCFPGLNEKGGDLPPRKECAETWHARIFKALSQVETVLLVGAYAQKWHLGARVKDTLTKTVAASAEYSPDFLPLPHPSWRNNAWLKKNPWFENDVLPVLRDRVAELVL